MSQGPAGPRARPSGLWTGRSSGRVERALENGRLAAECAAVGLLWAAFSLPVVTAGAAWLAAATVFDAWTRDEEPKLLPTFVAALRTQLRTGLIAEVALAVIGAAGYFDIRFAGAAHVPGAWLERLALALIAAGAAGLVLLVLADRAHTGGGVRDSLRGALALAGAAPWAVPLVVFAAAVCATLVAIIPALLLIVAGPLAYAVSVVHARARLRSESAPASAEPSLPNAEPTPATERAAWQGRTR
ncbi:DUF624 domain-containing protein [Rugosimonospora africana]|uniref:DUF624 domain-containing protein n=1 Tax=Rugosimonospora africana TaxID=556532 RepID=A0A8J3QYE7_9ACTN|nr:DUF624 domain-containing protein [Rugosimonospora africana]GIH18796.1 hypothetical protein Raf01_69680 [Rugosimonospora africana]